MIVCILRRKLAASRYSIIPIFLSDGFWGLTKNSDFKLWYENNVELYKPVDAPRKPKRKSGEVEDDWKQRMTLYRAKVTNWSVKTEEANQKYRQMKNKAFVSFAECQAWLYNHCAASFESSHKATIQAYEPATFVAELQKADSTLALDDLRIILAPPGTLCYCDLMQAYKKKCGAHGCYHQAE